jgi:AraC-like DNA-binding protein
MKPVIDSSHGTLTSIPSLPADWNGVRLSGSQPYTYQWNGGTLAIQKFQDPDFCICYTVLHCLKKIQLFWKEEPLLRFQYMLDGIMRYKGEGEKWIKLKSGQANAVWAPGRTTTAHFNKGKYELFQIAFNPELVKKLAPNFPNVRSFPAETSKQWIGEDRGKDIYEILDVQYSEHARRFFYETKIREHLLSFLLPAPVQGLDLYTEEEIERIYKIDRKILSNLNHHHTTEELVSYAKMPEAKLLSAFREIIGATMFDRYKEAKLLKAKKYLLETDIQVKVLYEMVGYDSFTGFVDAFTKRFGLSPLQYRKKYKPFD